MTPTHGEGNDRTEPSDGPVEQFALFNMNDELVPRDISEHIQLGEHNLRRQTADRIVGLFVKINAATLLTFFLLFLVDV